MISLIEPTYKRYSMVSPIAPIYKTRSRKEANQNRYLENRTPQIPFKDVLDREISMGLGSKVSVRV